MKHELADIRIDLLNLAARIGRLEQGLPEPTDMPVPSPYAVSLELPTRVNVPRAASLVLEKPVIARPFEIEAVPAHPQPIPPVVKDAVSDVELGELRIETARPEPATWREPNTQGSPRVRHKGVLGIGSLEAAVGGRWYAIAGAVIVVIGIGIFLTVAVQRGWVVLRPSFRCIAAGVFGLALIGTGERLRARVNAAASTGLFAAGVGVVFAACHVAHSMYGLVSGGVAAALLTVATLIGLGVAMRAGSSFIAALSVGLAYITPWMTMRESAVSGAIPGYAIALLVLGQVLGIRRPNVFSWAMRVAWLGTALTGGVWLALQGRSTPIVAVLFSAAAWGIVQFGLWARARGRFAEARSESLDPFDLRLWGDPVSSFVSTCWAFAGLYFVSQSTGLVSPAIPAFGLAIGSLLSALALAGHMELLTEKPRTGAERLGVSQMVQAGSLVVAGLALVLPTSTITTAFLVLAVGAMFAAERLKSRGLLGYGVAVLAAGAARAVTFDLFSPALRTSVDVWGLHVTLWSAIVGATGLAWMYGARACAGFGPRWRNGAYGFVVIATGLLLAAVLNTKSDVRAMAVAASVVVGAVAMSGRMLRGLRTEWVGGPLMIVPTLLWIGMYDIFDVRAAGVGAPLGAVWVGLWIAGILMLVRTRFDRGLEGLRLGIAALALICVLGATSVEVGRLGAVVTGDVTVRRAVVSAWWGIFAVVMIVAGFVFVKRNAATAHGLRIGGLVLLGGAALKAVIFDLGGVSALGRAGSLIGLGLLMLGVAAAYSKAKKALEPVESKMG